MLSSKSEALRFVGSLIAVATILGTVAFLDAGKDRMDRVDTLAPGPYIVMEGQDFLAVHDAGSVLVPKLVRTWTKDLANAWRYPTAQSAELDAKFWGGEVYRLRSIASLSLEAHVAGGRR